MRLWSIHPKYLDHKGLVALWREALLARAVLEGRTEGYKNHPQLERFIQAEHPLLAINTYLFHILQEARERNYSFDESKLGKDTGHEKLPVTEGQLIFELAHLKGKLARRCPGKLEDFGDLKEILVHPLFYITRGPIEPWERT